MNLLTKLLAFFLLLLTTQTMAQPNKDAGKKRFIKTKNGYLMVLRQGDDVLASIEQLAKEEQIPSANFSGMGFVDVRFGFFDFKTKKYAPMDFKGVELASMTGSVAWQDGKVSLHTHGVVTGKDFMAHGGHMLAATVSTGSVEIMITVHDQKLERIMEQPLGANVLSLDEPAQPATGSATTIRGVVQEIQQGKDGYTAKVRTDDQQVYFITMSRANLWDAKQYRAFKIGESIAVSGDDFKMGNEWHLTVRMVE